MIDHSLKAQNRGKFVIDLDGGGNRDGNAWLRAAAKQLPPERVILDETNRVLYDQRDVIGYPNEPYPFMYLSRKSITVFQVGV